MLRLFALLVALLPALAAPALAQQPKPAPCGDNFIEDTVGDPEYDPVGFGLTSTEGGPELDITRAFFSVQDGVISGTIEIENLAKKVPDEATGGVYYYFFYATSAGTKYVVARVLDSSTVEYRHGAYDGSTGTYFNDAEEVKGTFVEGEKGIVSMTIPAADGLTVGAEVAGIRANVDLLYGNDDETGLNVHADEAPNDGAEVSLIAAPCTAGTPPSVGAPSAPVAAPTTLPLTMPAIVGRASKARKGKSLTLRLEAGKPISALKLVLKAASGRGATLASGSRKALSGRGTLRLKLKRSLRKGRYTLIATGKVDGASLRAARQVAVR